MIKPIIKPTNVGTVILFCKTKCQIFKCFCLFYYVTFLLKVKHLLFFNIDMNY